ncbi:MAG TPA: pyridoxamine 5'-phosphate oxidase [Gemmataceae bacterium]|nr:pyridoxamine 5'-phosphate oxidase [Gemmataceae bacterium]
MSNEPNLLEQDAPANPFALFAQWYLDAETAELTEPSAMTLATADAAGNPSARMVLMRGFDERGFVFYTNYSSRKASSLRENPRAALVFYWGPLMRQIRVEGRVESISAEESDAYFRTRPFGHQLGALASPQSQVIPNREFLEERLAALLERFAQAESVPRPAHWGGYRVLAEVIEFWQGRTNRLHDRLRYRRDGNAWIIERLAP